jgi:hypothetical protein
MEADCRNCGSGFVIPGEGGLLKILAIVPVWEAFLVEMLDAGNNGTVELL